jgi:hypothetical protein
VNQPFGDPNTSFAVYGRGWDPRSKVTLVLDGRRAQAASLVTDKQGSFNYVLNQGQELFPAGLPVGQHTVTATGDGGRRAEISFSVGP